MPRSTRDGFTLVELLIVIAIIAILIALLLPATRRVRAPAARMACQNNLKQMMLAMHTHNDVLGHLPPGCLGSGREQGPNYESTPEERLSWMVVLLPYLEQDNLFKQFDLKKGYAGNLAAAQVSIKTFLCPAASDPNRPSQAVTNYVTMSGIGHDAALRPVDVAGNGVMGYDRKISIAKIPDGSSNTIFLMETRSNLGPWARGGTSTLRGFDPADVPVQGDGRPFGWHPDGMNIACGDGSVRFIRPSANPQMLANAITIAGGETIDYLD